MRKGNLSRRGFLERSFNVLTLAGLPAWSAREAVAALDEKAGQDPKPVAANDRIALGLIGSGPQGLGDMKGALKNKGVECVAVCDVDAARRDKAARDLPGNSDRAKFKDFRELLDRDDIDAVVIGTPDHWHALTAIHAMNRGKDVYCEKPLTLTVAEGKALVKVCRARDRVFQTGSQQRSDGRFRLACELVRNGRLGKVRTVEARIGENPKKGPFPTAPIPDGLDWDFWLGQTPFVDYVKQRGHHDFRWWYEYSGGKMTDWGAHHNDIAQWGLGMDDSGPVAVVSEGEAPIQEPNAYNCHPHFTVTYTYAEGASTYCDGTTLICSSKGENGVKFEGEKGWIFVNRSKITASDRALIDEPLDKDATRLTLSKNHMRNFLDCLHDRQRPICDVEVGHRSATVCHLGTISLRLGGKRLKWDPARERFCGDALADEMLSREMRAPWKLEA